MSALKMLTTVFRPEHIRKIDKHYNEISQKTSVAPALSDQQKTIKRLVLTACRKEGINADVTQLTRLTDGGSNYWLIAHSLLLRAAMASHQWPSIWNRFVEQHYQLAA